MCYIDSHIHLQDYKEKDVKNLVTKATEYKINTFVNISSHPSDWSEIKHLAKLYPQIIPAYGVHPWYIHESEDDWNERLENMLKDNPSAWVGECGIDTIKNKNIEQQLKVFEKHVYLAKKYDRPLIIHAVKASYILKDMLKIFPKRVIFHSFTDSLEWGMEIQKKGGYIGFNQSVLRKKNGIELIQKLDFNQILLETDGPYQSGQKNIETMPWDIIFLAENIAKIKGISVYQLEKNLYKNWTDFMEQENV